MAKGSNYFSHDYNARADEKIKLLIRKWGMQGYGVYWSIIEDLYQNANAMQLDSDGIAYDLRVDENMVKSILNDFDLFVVNGECFGSNSVEKRMKSREDKSKRLAENARKRWDEKQKQSNADAIALQDESKSKALYKKKVKEIIVKEKKEESIGAGAQPNPRFLKFQAFIQENAPDVAKMKEPFTEAQFFKLLDRFEVHIIEKLVRQMHNWKDLLRKRKSAYLTFLSFQELDSRKAGNAPDELERRKLAMR